MGFLGGHELLIYFRAISSYFHVTFLSLQVAYLVIVFPFICKFYTATTVNFCQTLLLLLFNTLRTVLLNCLNARSRGLTFRHRASCI